MFAGDNFYPPADGSFSNLIWESFPYGIKIQKNNQLATIEQWGSLWKISFNLIIYSNNGNGYSSVLRFTAGNTDSSQYGDRAPAIFYNNDFGVLHFTNAVDGDPNFYFDHDIELNRLYHIEIYQEEKDGKVSIPWLDLIYLV